MNNFEIFINETVIPQNWKILAQRLNMTTMKLPQQRLKIIGEIIEYSEARDEYNARLDHISYEKMCLELADICLSVCTLMYLQDLLSQKAPQRVGF